MLTTSTRRVAALAAVLALTGAACSIPISEMGNPPSSTSTTSAVSTTDVEVTTTSTSTTVVDTVAVPDVTGLPASDAEETLTEAGFTVTTSDSRQIGEFDRINTVAAQTPSAGTQVTEVGEVDLTLYGVGSGDVDADVEILADQSHGVIMDLLDRYTLLGPGSGRPALTSEDPFAGAVRTLLEVAEVMHDWMVRCHDQDACTDQYNPAPVDHQPAVIEEAGDEIIAYGDGTYLVSGVYYMGWGVFGAGYAVSSSFRFMVEDGQAVLLDVAVWPIDITGARGFWLAGTTGPNRGMVSVENLADGVDAQVTTTAWRSGSRAHYSLYYVLEVTNEDRETIRIRQRGVPASGQGEDRYNGFPDDFSMNQLVWTRLVPEGTTKPMLGSTAILPDNSGGDGFTIPVSEYAEDGSGAHLFDIRFNPERFSACAGPLDDHTTGVEPGECIRLSNAEALMSRLFGG